MNNLEDTQNLNQDYEGDISGEPEPAIDTTPYSYDLDIFMEPTTVGSLIKKFMRKDIDIPPFQRPYVWDFESKGVSRHKPSLFIDSVLLGLPIPSIVLYRQDLGENGTALVVDGQQRIKTLVYFKHAVESNLNLFDMGFALKGEDIDPQWIHKTYQDLRQEHGDTFIEKSFDERRVPVVYIRQIKPVQNDRPTSIYKLFDRLNSGGMELHAHEIRMALSFQNEETQSIFTLLKGIFEENEEFWKKLLPPSYMVPKNYGKKMEILYRVLVATFFYQDYKRPLRIFLDKSALKTLKDYKKSAPELKSILAKSIELLQIYYSNDPNIFRPNVRFNLKLFEAVWAGIIGRILAGKIPFDFDNFWPLYKAFVDKDYHNPIRTDNEGLYKQRYKMALGLFSETLIIDQLESPDDIK